MNHQSTKTVETSRPEFHRPEETDKKKTLLFTRLSTSDGQNTRIKKIGTNRQSLPQCPTIRLSRGIEDDMDQYKEFQRYCSTGRYKFMTEENDNIRKLAKEQALQLKKMELAQLKNEFDRLCGSSTRLLNQARNYQNKIHQETKTVEATRQEFLTMLDLEASYQMKIADMRDKQQLVETDHQTLKHMIDRMEADRVIHAKKLFELESIIDTYEKQTSVGCRIEEKTMVEQAESRLKFKKVKENHNKSVQLISQRLAKFENLQQKRSRETRMMKHAQTPPNNILPEHAQLLLVHNFLDKMLKSKVDRLKQDYEEMQTCFLKIKQSMMTSNCKFVDKFMTQNQTFEAIKKTVKSLQGQLNRVKQKHINLQNEYSRQRDKVNCCQSTTTSLRNLPINIRTKSNTTLFRLHKILSWLNLNLRKFKPQHMSQTLNLNNFRGQNRQNTVKARVRSSQIVEEGELVRQIQSNFGQLFQKIKLKMAEPEKPKIFKNFKTQGISIKKHIQKMTAQEWRERMVEKETMEETNRLEQEWISEVRATTKKQKIR